MTHSRSILAFLTVLSVVLGACSGAASPSPAAVSSPSPAALPSIGLHGDAALEAILPDQVAGQTLLKLSTQGASAFSSGASESQELKDVLGRIGKSASDASFAVATSASVTIGAFKVAGSDANAVGHAFIQAGQQANPGTMVTDASFGGKSVKKVVNPSQPKATYVYAHGEVMFFVQAGTDALLNEAFSKLP